MAPILKKQTRDCNNSKVLIGLVLFLKLALILSSSTPSLRLPNEEKTYLLQSNWQKLVPRLKEWKEKDKENPVIWWLLGYGNLAQGDYNAAIDAFWFLDKKEKISRLLDFADSFASENSNNPIALMLKGDALARSCTYDNAQKMLNKAVNLAPQSALILNVRGVVNALADRPAEAFIDFEKAVQCDPHFNDALVNIGIMRVTSYDFMGALHYLNRAVKLSSNFSLAYNARGLIYSYLKDWKKSEEDFFQAKKRSPDIPFFAGNSQLISRKRAQEQLNIFQEMDKRDHFYRTEPLHGAYEGHSVHIGEGKTVDIIVIKNTPQTATIPGMKATIKAIADKLYNESGLPENQNWKPRILLAQTVPGLHINASKMNFARIAFLSGKDFVISIDTTNDFKWHSNSTEDSPLRINENVSRKFERVAVALNHLYASPVDAVFESQSAGLIFPGKKGSVTLYDLHVQGKLHPDFRLNKVAIIGRPPSYQKTDQKFSGKYIGNAVLFTTAAYDKSPPKIDSIYSRPVKPVPAIEVLQWSNTPVPGAALFSPQWELNQINPLPEIIGLYMRGTGVHALRQYVEERCTTIPLLRCSSGDSPHIHIMISILTRRSLTDPYRDKILIGCKNKDIGEMIKAQYGRMWHANVINEIDSIKLQKIAKEERYTRIILVDEDGADGKITRMPSFYQVEPGEPSHFSLPELRRLGKIIDSFNSVIGVLYKISGKKVPPWLKFPMGLTGPVLKDIQSFREGNYKFYSSQTLRCLIRFSVEELPRIVELLRASGKLSASFKLPQTQSWQHFPI
jgi:tetratricopeptide (TPR) repeat protein